MSAIRWIFAAIAAVFLPASLGAQATQPAIPDLSYAAPIGGTWTYAKSADGSEATFVGASGLPQLIVHCTRAQRRVTIAKPAAAPAAYLQVWTSSNTRNLSPGFDPATARLSVSLTAFDQLLDSMVMSRGRIGIGIAGQPALVVPPWAEIGRVVEDCRV